MTPATMLPPALSRWAGPLSLLEPRLAVAIGPMVRVVDELMSRGDVAATASGALDGYEGLRRRGSPDLLVMSEWAVADAAPLEFLRRAAAAELLYLAPGHVEPRPRGRVHALVECGPDQVGAPRLVQLAALVVLAARAERRGTGLTVGVLGDPADSWLEGRTADVLAAWLRARRTESPWPEEIASAVAGRDEGLDDADELWIMTGPRAAAALPGRRRLVVSSECAWNEHGAAAVDVRVDGHRVELALPDSTVGVRALRGAMLRSREPARRTAPALLAARTPYVFTGSFPVLLARGDDPAELLRVQVRQGATSRVKVNRVSGTIVTAAVVGRRVLVLVERDGQLRVEVIGKQLELFDGVTYPADRLGVDGADVMDGAAFAPLGYEHGTLLTRLRDRWWILDRKGYRAAHDVLATGVYPTGELRVARRRGSGISIGGRVLPGVDVGDALPTVVLGGGGRMAWSTEPGRWRLLPNREVVLDDGETVLGLHEIDDAPALVVLSAAGLALRLRWPAGARTLTAWSGEPDRPSVHPVRPWVAVRRGDGSLEVGDLATGKTVVRTGSA